MQLDRAFFLVLDAVQTIMESRAWTAHSALFIIADEGDFNSDTVNGGLRELAYTADHSAVATMDEFLTTK